MNTQSDFSLRKWYLDCVADSGDTFIGYSAALPWKALTIHYSSITNMRGKTGYYPQEQLSFETLAVFENYYFAVGYGLTNAGDTASGEQMKDDIPERFRFKQDERTLVHQFSGGIRQKINLSLVLLHSPDLLILDKPYLGFDWETYLQFWEFAGILRKQGQSILTVSHLVYDRSRFDRLFELHNGILTCD